MKLVICLAIVSIATTIAGCANSPPPAVSWCDLNTPRRPTVAEYAAMDRISKEDMRIHNETGARDCGWRP